VNENRTPDGSARLKALLKETGLKSTRLDARRRLVSFRGQTREWSFVAGLNNNWLHIHTYVCEIPDAAGLRGELLDVAMTANKAMSLTKFSKSNGLVLELEYREEHLDTRVLGNLFALAMGNAEEYYPRLFRIVSGDAVLAKLSSGARESTAS
jgi:hypothetical protein